VTSIWGNDNGGGGSGANGHRVIITYSYSQNILGNYTDVSWQVGIDYGDPNYWNNIRNRTYSFSAVTGTASYVSGNATSGSDSTIINTSDPGYGGQIHYFYSGVVRITHDSNGHGTINMQASAMFNGSYTSSINTNVALPDIPQNPAAPSGMTASRTSDTQASLSWTNNSTGTAPYANIKVYRSVDNGAYSLITTLGVVTSYSDTTTSANHKYLYKVSAVGTNTAESAQSGASAAVLMTPAANSGLTATKVGAGDIKLDWIVNSNYKGNSELQHDIYDSPDGTTWNYVTTVFGATITYTHVAPSTAVTHRYRITTFPPSTTLYATSNVSNIITLLSTAAAPTGLAPAGVYKDATEAIVFTWTHNPTDGTAQTKYQLQYKIDAGSFVTVGPTSSGTSSYTMPASTLTNGHTITWHVATAGQNGTIGAYSADSVFTTSDRPTSTITVPTSSYTQSLLTTSWAYFQAQSSAQASWHAYLYRVDAGPTYVTLEEKTGTTESGTSFVTPLSNGLTYAVRVYVTSAVGLASVDAGTELQTFTVTFQPPAGATISAVYGDDTGKAIVTVVGSSPVSSIQALVLDGTGDWGSTVDTAVLDITGDIDMSIDVQANDWTPTTGAGLVEKWGAGANQRSYALVLTSGGNLRFRLSTDGTSGTIVEATSSVVTGFTDGTRHSVRVTRVGSTVTFYTSTDTDLSTATWTQLGTTQTAAGTMFSGSQALLLGADGIGAALNGNIFSALVKNSAGTTVAYPIYSTKAAGTTSFSDAPGRTWTLVGNANIATVIPGLEAIDHIDLQRRINGGDWVTWAAGVVLPIDLTVNVTDSAPITNGDNEYRALIYSALPSSAISNTADMPVNDELWGFLGYGNNFSTIVKMRARLAMRTSVGRAKATYHFAGREDPVELSGEQVTFGLAVSATLMGPSNGGLSSEPEELEAAGVTTGPILWRDHTGRRVFASLSDVVIDYNTLANKFPASFNLTRVAFDENVG